jgi:hypothetical protein
MAIVRSPRPRRDFTELANATIRDQRLSYRARGILVRLLSNEDGYRMTATDLAREGKEGRQAVLTAMRELRSVGYMITRRVQGSGGKWCTETWVYDTPQTSAEVRKPDSGKPGVGSRAAVKKPEKKNQQNHIPRTPLSNGRSALPTNEAVDGVRNFDSTHAHSAEKDVLDEYQGRQEAATRGEAPSLVKPEKWLAALREKAMQGETVLTGHGKRVRARREAEARLDMARSLPPALDEQSQKRGGELLRLARYRRLKQPLP